MNINEVKDKILITLNEELVNKTENEKQLLIDYSVKIIKTINDNFIPLNNNSYLHTGETPKCCIGCEQYNKHSINVCNCTLPYIEMIHDFID